MNKYSVDGVLSYEGLLMSKPFETEAESSKEALKKYLQNNNINLDNIKIKYGGEKAQVQVQPFRIGKDEQKYADGRATWWSIYKS